MHADIEGFHRASHILYSYLCTYMCIANTAYCMIISTIVFVAVSTGCQPENDTTLDIQWLLTAPGTIAEGQCPSGSGNNYSTILY